MSREIAPTNQFTEKKGVGARYLFAELIDHPDFAGFVTIAERGDGPVVAYMVDDPNHAGFVTPDTDGTEATKDAAPMIVGGGFAILVGS